MLANEILDLNHGIVALHQDKIVHFCGYTHEPTADDYINLAKELATDPEFGCMDIIDELDFVSATEGILAYFKNQNVVDNT